ncbi:hypothetical protein ACOQFV_24020 [Nocardiopsis changdeensis]|uniref:Uncharacterized protein n=1 Tax=Nocardiopsis changdeensis TaxID=2831969 RepID=A0A975KUJ7_9ACTN|nr:MULTISPECIES: hypothetical protein [Nocardiopsis]QUX26538.1 hypothetical protein KGD84_33100 [Nocardiopsis changdeensis]QYX40657.1 hypothetical protein K1J57_32170 [Nocardiopsis sp. MT53]
MDTEDLEQVRRHLPAHVHLTRHSATLTGSRREVDVLVLWTDHPYERCPRCREPLPRTAPCPLYLHAEAAGVEAAVEAVNREHEACGRWLDVAYAHLDTDRADAADVAELARDLAARWQSQVGHWRRVRRGELRELLQDLDTAPEEGETLQEARDRISAGAQMDPGPYWDADRGCWAAWDYDPGDDEQILIEHAPS